MTRIEYVRPPNFDRIVAKFPMAANRGVIFAYDGAIWNPSRVRLGDEIIAHEEAHLERQKEIGADLWWKRYIEEEEFRFNEELIAHRAELRYLEKSASSRQQRRRMLVLIAKKLSAALYGGMVSLNEAKELLRAEGHAAE